MFIRNAWYVAATAAEVADAPLGRTVCGQPMVLFRNAEGAAVALEDWCPHRGAPLSLGRVKNGRLVCGYHGLEMGCDGRTVAMPGQRVRGFPPVGSFPATEYGGFVWVWPGNPALAQPDALPQLPWVGAPDWAYAGGMYHVRCNYRLMIDNLMDLTHETYVHANSIGQNEIDETPCTTRTEGDQVITSRLMSGITAPPFWQTAMQAHGLDASEAVDRWQVCRFSPPSHVMIEVGVALAGMGGQQAPVSARVSSIVVDFITPENDDSMWYFWGMARNYRADDADLTERIREGQASIFGEDIDVLERQQANLARWPQRRTMNLNIDSGSVMARRVIDRMVAAEQTPLAA
jgi:vanillate O-demethylase monooxygenase subunit